jgi:hypothetical protein
MKNLNDPAGNQTRDLKACSEAPQTTAPLRNRLKDICCPIIGLNKPPGFQEVKAHRFIYIGT